MSRPSDEAPLTPTTPPDAAAPGYAYETDPAFVDGCEPYAWDPGAGDWIGESFGRLHEFTSRNSLTHGRAVGLGEPLRGTSWLNRPYEASLDFGAFLMTSRPASGVRSAHDQFAALTLGWDWDHYWGAQARLGWTTPSLGAGGADNLFLTDLSLMYYPWGDSRIRPYWRLGMGLTDIEFTNANGVRQQEFLYTIPFGIGVKHQTRPWFAWKLEVVDNLTLGINGTNTMNNFTLTCGLEARYGGRPSGYWAWRPRGAGW